MQVCIIGLGYVGLTLAIHLAKNGYNVHGIDISDRINAQLKQKKAHFYEKNFNIETAKVIDSGRFTFGKKLKNFSESTTYIITVGTPLTSSGETDFSSLQKVCQQLSQSLNEGDTVILRSTVKIGCTRDFVKPILDTAHCQYFLGFCPERTLEGSALEELASLPQIVSGVDASSLKKITAFFKPVCKEIVELPKTEGAELVKLINNSERDLMFAFANEVASMCDHQSLNANTIIRAANHNYPRSNLKKPGPVGGPCLEKDPHILIESFKNHLDFQPSLLKNSRMINENLIPKTLGRLISILDKRQIKPKTITILGFAFKGKPETDDMRGSLAIPLIEHLKKSYPEAQLYGHDYLVSKQEIIKTGVKGCETAKEAITLAELIILQNNHEKYREEDWENIIHSKMIILDFWNQLECIPNQYKENYYALGNFAQLSNATIIE